jgi:acyl-CoA hydrolase
LLLNPKQHEKPQLTIKRKILSLQKTTTMTTKTAKESLAIQTQIVMPNDTNPLGNLFGGQLLLWMDIVASISAQRHCGGIAVTASVNNVSFNIPILRSSIVTLHGKVSRAFKSSMEIFIDVWVEDTISGKKQKCNEAIYTFVGLHENGKVMDVPQLIPETDEEKERYEGALRRKQLSLILAGKLHPSEASELRTLFIK